MSLEQLEFDFMEEPEMELRSAIKDICYLWFAPIKPELDIAKGLRKAGASSFETLAGSCGHVPVKYGAFYGSAIYALHNLTQWIG